MAAIQTIRFCDICENKLYHRVEEDSLVHFCRVCGTTDTNVNENEGVCVLNIHYGNGMNDDEMTKPLGHIYNKYTKYDPTLPHLLLLCPNEQCETHKKGEDAKSDVIYIRYDNTHMKHLYICTACDYTWKSNN